MGLVDTRPSGGHRRQMSPKPKSRHADNQTRPVRLFPVQRYRRPKVVHAPSSETRYCSLFQRRYYRDGVEALVVSSSTHNPPILVFSKRCESFMNY